MSMAQMKILNRVCWYRWSCILAEHIDAGILLIDLVSKRSVWHEMLLASYTTLGKSWSCFGQSTFNVCSVFGFSPTTLTLKIKCHYSFLCFLVFFLESCQAIIKKSLHRPGSFEGASHPIPEAVGMVISLHWTACDPHLQPIIFRIRGSEGIQLRKDQ